MSHLIRDDKCVLSSQSNALTRTMTTQPLSSNYNVTTLNVKQTISHSSPVKTVHMIGHVGLHNACNSPDIITAQIWNAADETATVNGSCHNNKN